MEGKANSAGIGLTRTPVINIGLVEINFSSEFASTSAEEMKSQKMRPKNERPRILFLLFFRPRPLFLENFYLIRKFLERRGKVISVGLQNLPKRHRITLPPPSFPWTHCPSMRRARGHLSYHRCNQRSKPSEHRKHPHRPPSNPNLLKKPLSTTESTSTPAEERQDNNTHPDAQLAAIDFKKPKQPRR